VRKSLLEATELLTAVVASISESDERHGVGLLSTRSERWTSRTRRSAVYLATCNFGQSAEDDEANFALRTRAR
jgi:hypothetical protein